MSLTFSQSSLERPVVIVPVALLLLAAAAGLMWSNLTIRSDAKFSAAPAAKAAPITVAVLVSAADIPRGRVLNAQDMSLQLVAPVKVPAASLHRAEDAQGHMALAAIPAGTPILNSQISADAVAGLSARIPQSYRAYAIPVSEADIAGGFIQAGDLVDLYVTLPSALFSETLGQKPGDHSKATLLLQSVRVLAVGGKLKSDGSANPSVRTVTLALSAADLAKAALATRLGTITFGIRNPVDDAAQPGSQAELSSLLGDAAVVSRIPEKTRPRSDSGRGVAFYSGRDHSTLHLP